MESIKIKCEIVTPLLMHGVNKNIAELRPPSIKGVMRFWWRAIHGNLSLDELKEKESKIFGGAGDGNAVQSSFKIKLNSYHLKTKQFDPVPHKPKRKDGSPYFTIIGFEDNQSFEIEFITHYKEIITKIFKLSTVLGGFGQRSRRGFGSIQIDDNNNHITENSIKQLIKDINEGFNYSSKINYPYIKNIEIGKKYNDINILIRTISSATHTYNYDGMFGAVTKRYASPIYISIIKNNNSYQPIITTLNATKNIDKKRLQDFKGAIL